MYKHILENAGDISSMALIPLLLFFLVFAGALILAMVRSTKDMERMSRLPFEDALSEHIENEIKS
jgi:hypothetical protein